MISQLPSDIENIVLSFAYCMTLDQINRRAYYAWLITRDCPVPENWKKLYTIQQNVRVFDWHAFLKTNMHPNCPQCIISLRGVRETIESLNWHFIKQLHSTAARFLKIDTKTNVLTAFNFWTPRSHKLLFLLQRLICGLDNTSCLNKAARDNMMFSSVFITNGDPLCQYLHYTS